MKVERRGSKCEARLYDSGYIGCPHCEHCRKLAESMPRFYLRCERKSGHKGKHRSKGVEWK
jgi:hypothetical protein